MTSETNKHPNDELGQKEIGSQAGSFNHKVSLLDMDMSGKTVP